MAKHRRGLHKEITSIFDGVPLPKGDDTKQPRRDSSPNQNDNQQGRPDPARERYNAPVVPKNVPTAPTQTQAAAAPKLSRMSQNQQLNRYKFEVFRSEFSPDSKIWSWVSYQMYETHSEAEDCLDLLLSAGWDCKIVEAGSNNADQFHFAFSKDEERAQQADYSRDIMEDR